MKIEENLIIKEVCKETESSAKNLVVSCLKEYFDDYDHSRNKDLDRIIKTYNGNGHLFLVGIYNEEVVCTGGLIETKEGYARVVRVSVRKDLRRKGIGKKIMKELEKRAIKRGFDRIVLDTRKNWHGAIKFYKDLNYSIYGKDDLNLFFEKKL